MTGVGWLFVRFGAWLDRLQMVEGEDILGEGENGR